MLKIVASQVVKEECVDEFIRLGKELVAASVQEAGNKGYSLNISVQDPRVFMFIELWEDKAAIEAHNVSEHFQRIFPQLGAMVEEGSSSIQILSEV